MNGFAELADVLSKLEPNVKVTIRVQTNCFDSEKSRVLSHSFVLDEARQMFGHNIAGVELDRSAHTIALALSEASHD